MELTYPIICPLSCKFCSRSFSDFNRYHEHKKHHRNRYLQHWLSRRSRTIRRPNRRKRLIDEDSVPQQKWLLYSDGRVTIRRVSCKDYEDTGNLHFSCKVCHRAFSAAIHMIRHERQAHNRESATVGPEGTTTTVAVDKKRFRCKYCDKGHHNKADLDYHTRSSHTGETITFTCEVCKATFKRKVYLNRHMRIHNDIRPYVCKVCGKSFIKGGGLKEHERTHTGEKPYKCGTCNRGFSGRANLRRHEMTHSGEQPFECKECGKRCNRIASLRQHMRIHTGERPYNCMHCNKAFPTCANLRRHERTHLEKKQFHCRQCGKEFTQKYTLKLHEMNHLGIRPHLCLLCGKSFMEKRKLKGHLSTVHGITESEDSENNQKFALDLALEGSKAVNIPDEIRGNVISDLEGAHVKTLEDFQAYWKAAYLDDPPTPESSKTQFSGQLAKPTESASKLHAMLTTLPQNTDKPLLPQNLPVDEAFLPLNQSIQVVPSSKSSGSHDEPSTVSENGALNLTTSTQSNNHIRKRKRMYNHVERKTENAAPSPTNEEHDSSGTEDYEFDMDDPNAKRRKASPSLQITDQDMQVTPQNGSSIFNRFSMPGQFNCHMCGQTFTSQIVLEIHMRTHQRPDSQSFCVQCNKSFNNILDLEDHIKTHGKPAGHDSSSNSNEAMPSDIQPVEYKSYCMACNKTFGSSLELAEHIMHHDEQRALNKESSANIPNNVSGISNVQSPDKLTNLLTKEDATKSLIPKRTSGEKKRKMFTCEECGKEYRKRISYTRHLETHKLGIIPVECVANVDNMQTYSDVKATNSSATEQRNLLTPKLLAKVNDSDTGVSELYGTVDEDKDLSHLSSMTDGTSDVSFDEFHSKDQSASLPAMNTNDFHYEGITDKKFECKICFQNFPRQEHLNGHMNKHKNYKYKVNLSEDEESDTEKPFACTVCGKAFAKQERLAGHMNKHKEYKIKVETMEEAITKMKKINGPDRQDKWQCPYCEKHLVTRAKLVEHLHDHIRVEPYTCEVCNKGFSKKANYVSHQATHNDELNYECEECHKKFKYSQSLKKHMSKCKKTYSCSQCGGLFSHKRSLNSHVWNVHVRVENCTCKVCGKVMSSASGLREHELIHSGEKPYQCDICMRGFANRSNLRRHVMIHDNDRPFVCQVCNMTFNRLASLQQHERCHTGEKPYGCSICGLFFTSKSTRRKHEKRHTKKKDKKCKFCDKMFWDKYSCRMHERVHTGDLPFECTLCNKKFPERNVLMRHMKLVHKDWYAVNMGMKDGTANPLQDHSGDGDHLEGMKLLPLSDEEDKDEVDYHLSSDTEDEGGDEDTPQDMVVDLGEESPSSPYEDGLVDDGNSEIMDNNEAVSLEVQ